MVRKLWLGLALVACDGTDNLPEEEIAAVDGTSVVFAPGNLSTDFFATPFPNDLRLEDGQIRLKGLPALSEVPLLAGLVGIAEELNGHSALSVGYFHFDGPVRRVDTGEVILPGADAPVLLLNVDPSSPTQGEALPVVAHSFRSDGYLPDYVVGVSPAPGVILRPDTTYAFVIQRNFQDGNGEPLGVPLDVERLKAGASELVPDGAARQPHWTATAEALTALGGDPSQVAAATHFTTGDVVTEVHEMSEALRGQYDLSIDNLALAPERGTDHPRYCELHGEITFPQFQRGEPLFNTEGLFEMGEDGLPVEQREATVPVVITLPRQTMPEDGFPLGMYFHGSGGTSDQLVIRGPRATADGEPAMGLGPAYVLATHGIAGAGSAHPVNPERVPGASEIAYLNFSNLAAFRDTFRQGIIEQRLYIDALANLEIPADVLDGCDGIGLPEGATTYRLDEGRLVAMGQSMGGMYTNLVGAVEPRIRAVVPTGAGGHWSSFVLNTERLGEGTARTLIRGILNVEEDQLIPLHPALHVLQLGWEAAEPLVYVPRLARRPLPGHPVRPVYEPVGLGDTYFRYDVFDEMSLAYGNQQAGESVWPSMQDVLALDGLDGIQPYPVQNNVLSESGEAYTGVVVQSAGDGFSDPHVIFTQVEEIKHQYGCFFASFLQTGTATVPEGDSLDAPCGP